LRINTVFPLILATVVNRVRLPIRARGSIYCGVINARVGMTRKAIALKSGMADASHP
jgi:hypothetical protein